MTVKEIVEVWLDDNGYDGLCNVENECACMVEDGIFLCDECQLDCEAGHLDPDRKDDDDYVIIVD